MSPTGTLKAQLILTLTQKGTRSSQEDSLLVDREKGIFVVADGFGGPVAGLQAAKTACEFVKTFLFREAGDLEATLPFVLHGYLSLSANVLFNALVYANRKLLALNQGKNINEKGGASVVAGFIDEDRLALANIGNCNAYLLRKGERIEPFFARNYGRFANPFQNEAVDETAIPLRTLGITEDIEPEMFECRVQKGDWLLLSTDGLPKKAVNEITQLQNGSLESNAAVTQVEALVKGLDVKDNASIALVLF